VADRLSGLDSSFLHLERHGAHMHVASVSVFEGETPSYEEFRAHLARRLERVPRFRQRVRFVPLGQGRPVWVDDPHLNMDYHVRHTALPAPGGEEELRTLAARVFSQRLDRSKPLWEMWLVDGLDGDRFAIIGKSHHCLVDGVSGMDITTVLFDTEPDPPPPAGPPPRWSPEPEPSDVELLAEALLERATSPVEAVRGIRALLRHPRRIGSRVVEAVEALASITGTGLGAPPSPFNVPTGPYRRFAWASAELAQMKRIKNFHGGTVNDVILSVVAGALGHFLRARGHVTEGLELRAMVPVSVRTSEQRGSLGNHVAAMMAPLPVWCEDPVERLELVSERMAHLKDSRQTVGATVFTELTDFAPPTLVSQAARLQPRQRFFNLVVTNIPGPQSPLYVLGRRLLRVVPMVPLAERQALCVGIFSYDGRVDFGLVGDYDAIPGLHSLALDLERTIEELEATVNGSSQARRRGAGSRSPSRSTP
jgi:diacylglycerol O-acyltransferase / wax synthase